MFAIAGGILLALVIICNFDAIVEAVFQVALGALALGAFIALAYGAMHGLLALGVPDQVLIDIMAVTVVGGMVGYLLFAFIRAAYRAFVVQHERDVTVSHVRSIVRQQRQAQRP